MADRTISIEKSSNGIRLIVEDSRVRIQIPISNPREVIIIEETMYIPREYSLTQLVTPIETKKE
jgi:hypothetical protein